MNSVLSHPLGRLAIAVSAAALMAGCANTGPGTTTPTGLLQPLVGGR